MKESAPENNPKIEGAGTRQRLEEFLSKKTQISVRALMLSLSIKKPEAESLIQELISEGRLKKGSGGKYILIESNKSTPIDTVANPTTAPNAITPEAEQEIQADLSPMQTLDRQIEELKKELAREPDNTQIHIRIQILELKRRNLEIAEIRRELEMRLGEIEGR